MWAWASFPSIYFFNGLQWPGAWGPKSHLWGCNGSLGWILMEWLQSGERDEWGHVFRKHSDELCVPGRDHCNTWERVCDFSNAKANHKTDKGCRGSASHRSRKCLVDKPSCFILRCSLFLMSGNSWPAAQFAQTAWKKKERCSRSPAGSCKDEIPHRGLNSRGEVLSTEGWLGDGGVDSWCRFRKHSVPFYPL